MDELEINRQEVARVAAIVFDDQPHLKFTLNRYKTKQDIIQGIRHIQHMGGRTNIADALRMAQVDVFIPGSGDREGAPNFAVLFTDGASNVNEDETLPQAIAARVAGIHIITVAVGQSISMPELQGLTSHPYESNMFTVGSYQDIYSLVPDVLAAMCDGKIHSI